MTDSTSDRGHSQGQGHPSSGYTALWERNRLDLTVEALVTENPEWWELFTPAELERARKRLGEYRYTIVIRTR
jgi:hypothetical protein